MHWLTSAYNNSNASDFQNMYFFISYFARFSECTLCYLTLKLDRVVAPPADLSPLTEIPPSPITEAVVEDDGISAED